MLMRHGPISGASWRVILVARIGTQAAFTISEEEFLLGPPYTRSILWNFTLEPQITICSSSAYSTSLNKAQGPIYDFWALIPTVNFDNIMSLDDINFDNIMPLLILTLLFLFCFVFLFFFLHFHFDNIMLVNIHIIIFNIMSLY